MTAFLTDQVQLSLDFDLDGVDGLDGGVNHDDNLVVVNVPRLVVSRLVHHRKGSGLDDAGGGGESRAGSGQADGWQRGAGLVVARARDRDSRDGADIVDRSGHGGANREGSESGAEELHCAG